MKRFTKLLTFILSLAVMLSSISALSLPCAAASTPSITIRIEGQKSTIYPATSVNFTSGEDFYDIMCAALAAKNIPIVATDGQYGHEITSIGDESGTYPLWWHLYVNDQESDVGRLIYTSKRRQCCFLPWRRQRCPVPDCYSFAKIPDNGAAGDCKRQYNLHGLFRL